MDAAEAPDTRLRVRDFADCDTRLGRVPSLQKRHSYASNASASTDDTIVSLPQEVSLCEQADGEVQVLGGTLRGLLEFGMCCFEVSNTEVQINNRQFLSVLFLMHEWLADSVTIASTIIDLCSQSRQMLRKGLFMIRFWIHEFPAAFESNRSLAAMVETFFERVNARELDEIVSVSDIRATVKHEWLRLDSLKKSRVNHNSVNSLVFHQLESEQLAAQLTVLEFKAFRKIRPLDLKNYTTGENLRDSPFLEKSVALFNGLSQWVQCMVLSKTTPADRAATVAKFLEVSEELRKLHNYNTLMAVIGGLSHSSIARLTKTHACLSQKSQKLQADFMELLSSSNNFVNYRKEYSEAQSFKIPILAVHLKDLIQMTAALPDRTDSGRFINFRKVAQLAQTVRLLTAAQGTPLLVEENPNLCNTLRLSLDCHYTEDDIYEVSLLREPRSLTSPPTPTKPVVFAQWVSGSKPPHPELLKRHIFDMVEAVFKVYDHDRDEMISEAEFEQIAENFPFIDSFAVLDADNDGMISKTELKNYFIRANSHALKSSFKHDFHEASYFKPTFCDRCSGLLWGLIKQGWKCRDCGINVHRHCKDNVVMECRQRQQPQHQQQQRLNALPEGNSHDGCQHGNSEAAVGCRTEEKWTQADGNCCDSQQQLLEAERMAEQLAQEKQQLQEETESLRQQLEEQSAAASRLKAQVVSMRQHTLSFILNQMDTLQIQRNSEV